jgi:malate synthase
MIRPDVLQAFPGLFGTKRVNGRDLDVDETITRLTREIDPAIAEALSARRATLQAPAPVAEKYAWPRWEESFEDPVSGKRWTFRQIVQGLVDNFQGRESPWRWRLNDEVAIPEHVHPSRNPGLELTGPSTARRP